VAAAVARGVALLRERDPRARGDRASEQRERAKESAVEILVSGTSEGSKRHGCFGDVS
jgi:hypothetical protein